MSFAREQKSYFSNGAPARFYVQSHAHCRNMTPTGGFHIRPHGLAACHIPPLSTGCHVSARKQLTFIHAYYVTDTVLSALCILIHLMPEKPHEAGAFIILMFQMRKLRYKAVTQLISRLSGCRSCALKSYTWNMSLLLTLYICLPLLDPSLRADYVLLIFRSPTFSTISHTVGSH